MKRKTVSLLLAVLLALSVCGSAALAYSHPAAEGVELLYCHGSGHHGSRSGGHGHHGESETCDWLFHACGKCRDVNCTDEDHDHRCPLDCDEDHRHYGVCQYDDGTLELVRKRA